MGDGWPAGAVDWVVDASVIGFSSSPFIAKKTPTIAIAATSAPMPMNIGALFAGGAGTTEVATGGAAGAFAPTPSGKRPPSSPPPIAGAGIDGLGAGEARRPRRARADR